jgi:hypothetical protein
VGASGREVAADDDELEVEDDELDAEDVLAELDPPEETVCDAEPAALPDAVEAEPPPDPQPAIDAQQAKINSRAERRRARVRIVLSMEPSSDV